MEQFKIRCSSMSEIMGALKGGLTDVQSKNLATLEAKEKRTAKQDETLKELIAKRDMPKELPKTCVTYLEKWVKEKHFNWRKDIGHIAAVKKGNICEDEAISMLIENYGLSYNEKNEQFFENDYICGTPDLIYPDRVYDTKCSESPDTFPMFEDSPMKSYNFNYWCQGQAYMALTGVHYYSVVYAMCSTPEELLSKQIYNDCFTLSQEDREVKELQIRINHNFDHVPLQDRLKRFDFAFEPKYMEHVYERVRLCRRYIESNLIPKLTKGSK